MSEPFLGQIMQVGFNYAPRGWAMCDGQLLPIGQNTALFSLLGTIYGGDGRTTFALPDLRGRVAVHPGTGPGLSPRIVGQRGGAETQTLSVSQLPPHTHSLRPINRQFIDTPASSQNQSFYPAAPTVAGRPVDAYIDPENVVVPDDVMNSELGVAGATPTESTGGQQAFSVMPPYIATYFVIALQGIYPSRN